MVRFFFLVFFVIKEQQKEFKKRPPIERFLRPMEYVPFIVNIVSRPVRSPLMLGYIRRKRFYFIRFFSKSTALDVHAGKRKGGEGGR